MSNVTEKDVTTQRMINALRVCQGDSMTSEDCMKECPFANADDCGFVRGSTEMLEAAADRLEKLCAELARYKQWVDDLQSGMYVNCVYCGHRYGPEDKVPTSMAEALKQHVEQCPKHPMSALKAELAAVKVELATVKAERDAAVAALRDELSKALKDMACIAGDCTGDLKCSFCLWNPNDMGCELDGSQFDDAGECHFQWGGKRDACGVRPEGSGK